jgi:hypothetical protein
MFNIPENQYNSLEHARNSLHKANTLNTNIILMFIDAYHDFWGVGSANLYTTEMMQQKIDSMGNTPVEQLPEAVRTSLQIPEGVTQISTGLYALFSAYSLVTFINAFFPNTVAPKYLESAYEYTINQDYSITIGQKRNTWT